MKRVICRAIRAAAVATLALVVSPAIASAQDPLPAASPAEETAAPAAQDAAVTAPPNNAATSTDPSGCKGLAEKPCRKNTACYWIIPKEAGKSGKVKPPYCHKRGHSKKKKKKTNAAAPQGAPPAETPSAEQTAPPPEEPSP